MSKMWNYMNCDDGGCKLLVKSSSNVRRIKLPWWPISTSTVMNKTLSHDCFPSCLVDKRVVGHPSGAGMQILTKQCEDEHDKEALYGPVSLAHKNFIWTGIGFT